MDLTPCFQRSLLEVYWGFVRGVARTALSMLSAWVVLSVQHVPSPCPRELSAYAIFLLA